MDCSVVFFARWRQCAPHLIDVSLGPPESTSQTPSPSVRPFCTPYAIESLYFRVPILYNGPPLKLPLRMGRSGRPHGSLGPPESTTQTASRSVQPFLKVLRLCQSNRETEHTSLSVTISRIYVAVRCGLQCDVVAMWSSEGGRSDAVLSLAAS